MTQTALFTDQMAAPFLITEEQIFQGYAGHPGILPAHREAVRRLLPGVNGLLAWAVTQGWSPKPHPATRSMVSGTKNGGWRPENCATGAPNSSHKEGRAVDAADADNSLDALISKYDTFGGAKNEILERFNLYREHPSATNTWCHLTDRRPNSGRRSFYP